MSNNTNLIIYSLEKKAMSFSCELKKGAFFWAELKSGVGGAGWLSPLGLFSRFSVLNCNLLKRCHCYKTVYGLHLRSADPVGAVMERTVLRGGPCLGAPPSHYPLLLCGDSLLCVTSGYHPRVSVWRSGATGWCTDHPAAVGLCYRSV